MASDSALKACGRFSVSVTTPRASLRAQHQGSSVVIMVRLLTRSRRRLLARSRNWNFWILPVLVLGIGSKRISRGTL